MEIKKVWNVLLNSESVRIIKKVLPWIAVIGVPIDLYIQGAVYPFDAFRILTALIFGSYILGIGTEGSDYEAVKKGERNFKVFRFAMFLSVVAILVSTLHLMNGVMMAGAIALMAALAVFEI